MARGLRVATYSRLIREEAEDANRYMMLMHDLPRRFHRLSRKGQTAALEEAAPLTGTRWDALLAAVTEHIARLHGHPVPEWVEEPERFLDTPWVISTISPTARDCVLYAPGAFIRHGALPDPLDLDASGGEKHAWVP